MVERRARNERTKVSFSSFHCGGKNDLQVRWYLQWLSGLFSVGKSLSFLSDSEIFQASLNEETRNEWRNFRFIQVSSSWREKKKEASKEINSLSKCELIPGFADSSESLSIKITFVISLNKTFQFNDSFYSFNWLGEKCSLLTTLLEPRWTRLYMIIEWKINFPTPLSSLIRL